MNNQTKNQNVKLENNINKYTNYLFENATILIVDDNVDNIKLLIHFLSKYKFETWVATSGSDALSQLEYATPDIILLDIMMPGIDGFETCQKIKQNNNTKDIPIIFMTALSDIKNKVKGFQAGAVDYVTKPIEPEEVLMRVTTHLTVQLQRKELLKLNEKLSKLNITKDRFFSIIAHDLKGVFTPLIASSDVLVKLCSKDGNTTVSKFAQSIHKSSQNAYKLLENLLEWARIQKNNIKVNPAKFDLMKRVKNMTDIMMEKANQKNVTISNLVEKNTFVYADVYMVQTILINLISNALKYTENGEITIFSNSINDDFYEVVISDTGTGISSENQKKLFVIEEKFKVKGTAGEIGTGLGLILCKELVEKNGGKIWVESEPGVGSQFIFTLKKFKEGE